MCLHQKFLCELSAECFPSREVAQGTNWTLSLELRKVKLKSLSNHKFLHNLVKFVSFQHLGSAIRQHPVAEEVFVYSKHTCWNETDVTDIRVKKCYPIHIFCCVFFSFSDFKICKAFYAIQLFTVYKAG